MQRFKLFIFLLTFFISFLKISGVSAKEKQTKPYTLKYGKSITDFYFTNLTDERIKQITIIFSAFDSDGICAFENETVSFVFESKIEEFQESSFHIDEEEIAEESGFSGSVNDLITDYAWISEIVYESGKTFRDPLGRFAE